MTETVAVTGGSGFVGRTLLEQLASEGWTVRALSRKDGADLPASIESVQGSLQDKDALRRLIDGADRVIHCGGLIKAPRRADFFSTNADATAELAAACERSPTCRQVIYISTLAARIPGISHYADSKRAGEEALKQALSRSIWTILRPPAVYGPGDRETLKLFGLVDRGLLLVPSHSGSRMALIYVHDLCTAITSLLGKENAGGQTLEVRDSRAGGYPWSEIARAAELVVGRPVRPLFVRKGLLRPAAYIHTGISRIFGRAPMVTPGKLNELYHSDWTVSANPVTDLTGWQPTVTINDGMSRAIAWYRSHGWM
jgi:nucleoside-diphosphate-sugar epimerase